MQTTRKTLAVAALLAAFPLLATAQAPPDLRPEIDRLQKRVEELEKQMKPEPAGAIRLPGSETTLKIGGYVKLDAIFSSRSAGTNSGGDQLLTPQLIPVGPGAGDFERDQLTLHARESRINFGTRTPTRHGPLTTFIEGDFFGAAGNETVSNSHSFRLRHAFGTIGPFLAGQTWSNFMYLQALPETLNFGGTAAEIFIRQAQVRWTQPFDGGAWSLSLENPESLFATPGSASFFRADDDRYPDIIGRVDFGFGRTKMMAAALVRNIRVDSGAAPVADDDAWGLGLELGAVVPFGRNDLRAIVYGGNGIGRYKTPGFYADGVLDAAGNIELADVLGGRVAYRHFWSDDWRSNFVIGASTADYPTTTFSGVDESTLSAHVNLIWRVNPDVDVGVEYIHANRELISGVSGSLNRVQFSAKYSF